MARIALGISIVNAFASLVKIHGEEAGAQEVLGFGVIISRQVLTADPKAGRILDVWGTPPCRKMMR